MNRFVRNDYALRAGDNHDEDDEERLYERRALIFDDNDDICDYEINNSGQVALRHRQQSDKQRALSSNGYELKSINTKPYRDSNIEISQAEFTYYDIQAGDSLQSICLRYACPINQVKRMNGLMTDQDFHGLRRLKLPLGRLGLLEDILKQQQNQNNSLDLLLLDDITGEGATNQVNRPRLVNSPGSALSVASRHNNPRFRPLLNTGYSSDRINELDNRSSAFDNNNYQQRRSDHYTDLANRQTGGTLHHNSHSFSSLREFANGDANINIANQSESITSQTPTTKLPQQSFIKSEIVSDPSQVTIDNLLGDEQPAVANVFQDLDYHVERAKVAAESYEQRATEIVNGIEASSNSNGLGLNAKHLGPRPSRIPELFFSGENFGLNIKRLVMLIVFVCLVIPLVYISRANIIK